MADAAPEPRDGGPQPGMQALTRGLMVLDVVGAASRPMRFSTLLDATGLPKGTLHRIVQTLLDERYLMEWDGGYRLGVRPMQLAHKVWDGFDLRAAAAPELARLCAAHGEAVRLAIPEAGHILYIDQADFPRAVRVASAVGERAPIHSTALGKAIAAHMDQAERRALLQSALDPVTATTITDADTLDRQLNRVKALGYAVALGEQHEELVAVAAPVLDHRARPLGAIGIVGPAFRLSEERLHALGREVMEAARRTSGNAGELAMSIAVTQKPLHVVREDIALAVPGSDFLGEGPHWHAARKQLTWVDILAPALVTADPLTGARTTRQLPELTGCAIPRKSGGFVLGTETGIRAIDQAGILTTLAEPEKDRPGNRLNDGKCDSAGRLWVGSLAISTEPGRGALWRLDDRGAMKMLDGIDIANGLGWSPDNATFYFTDSGKRTITAFDYDAASGEIANPRPFAALAKEEGVPDGLAVDEDGFIWSAIWDGWSVRRYAPDGTLEREITLPVPRPTSCAFGGPDLTTLYVTTARVRLGAAQLEEAPLSGALLAIDAGVAGLPVHDFAF